MRPPLLTVLTVVADPQRITLTRQMINQLIRQSYLNLEYLVVNATEQPVFTDSNPQYKEIQVNPRETLGTPASLRNIGIRSATGEWIILTDDDDIHHPSLFAAMMAHRRNGAACLLTYQLRVDVRMGSAMSCLVHEPTGIPGTMLFPRLIGAQPVQFEISSPDPESEFLQRNFRDQLVLLDNDSRMFPGPVLNIATFHGRNVATYQKFFGQYADPQYAGHWAMLNDTLQSQFDSYIRWAFSQRGLNLEVRHGGQPGAASAT
jgi:glycosyltransferase involved in cell wall biosynthesis